jgi:secondary thiamine-phosphate synthase enzyme
MKLYQSELHLSAYHRGMHLITGKIEEAMGGKISTGTLQLFLKHTSASLALNENADPTVRSDAESFLNDLVPESYPHFEHTYEGSDDMPAHMKNILIGSSLTLPVTHGRLNLGTWQGIYLCEHRDYAGGRTIILTLTGV